MARCRRRYKHAFAIKVKTRSARQKRAVHVRLSGITTGKSIYVKKKIKKYLH